MSKEIVDLMTEARFYAEKMAYKCDCRPYKRYRNNLADAFMAGAEWQRRREQVKAE